SVHEPRIVRDRFMKRLAGICKIVLPCLYATQFQPGECKPRICGDRFSERGDCSRPFSLVLLLLPFCECVLGFIGRSQRCGAHSETLFRRYGTQNNSAHVNNTYVAAAINAQWFSGVSS